MWFLGIYGSITAVGAVLSIIHKTSPLTSNDYYKDNMEFTSLVIKKISEIGGPRCCKRNAFLSLSYAVDFIEKKYGIYKDEDRGCLHPQAQGFRG